MDINDIRINKKQDIIALTMPYGVDDIKVFGSYARGDNKHGSDLDLLLRLKKNISLLKFARLERELSENIGINVQLISEAGLNPLLKTKILDEAVPL